MKCILIVIKGNFSFLLGFNRGERDIFFGRAGIFNAVECRPLGLVNPSRIYTGNWGLKVPTPF